MRRASALTGTSDVQTLAAVCVRHRLPRRGEADAVFGSGAAWNVGISFGWFQNDGPVAQIILMLVKAVAVIVLAIWMARSRTPVSACASPMARGSISPYSTFQSGGKTLNRDVFNLAGGDCCRGSGPAV
jgi:hypothetical protein